ncbi:MAG: hypothetical protein P4M09_30855 [Devosia sp.]|nr:hypothetical protein [Devosia sp.]
MADVLGVVDGLGVAEAGAGVVVMGAALSLSAGPGTAGALVLDDVAGGGGRLTVDGAVE